MWPFRKAVGRSEPVTTTHDRTCWKSREVGGSQITQCTRCGWAWSSNDVKPACRCTLPLRHPVYPGPPPRVDLQEVPEAVHLPSLATELRSRLVATQDQARANSEHQPNHREDMAKSTQPPCPPGLAKILLDWRLAQGTANASHGMGFDDLRRQHELLEAEHAVRVAVARWRAENPALASQWLGKPADTAQAATNSVAERCDLGKAFDDWLTGHMLPAVEREAYRLNTAGSVAVATDTYWNEDMATAPRGVKLQLLSIGGVAQYDTYKGEAFWVGWAPVPRRRPA